MRAGLALAALAAAVAAAVPAAAATTPTQLALMPLPKAALGPAAAALPLDPESGVQTNKQAAGDALTPTSAADLARLGRITGYQLDYSDAAGHALATGRGLLEAVTGVELYGDVAAATRGLAFWRRDAEHAAALKASGFSIRITPFAAHGYGEASYAFFGAITVKGKRPFYGAEIIFRVGSLLAAASATSPERGRPRPLAEAFAQRLQQRIALVLVGKISGTPVPLPGQAKAGPPPNGPDLAALALKPADLGRATVRHQGYKLDTDLNPISEYARELGPAGAFADVREEVALLHSPTEASYTFSFLGEALSSSQFVKAILGADKTSSVSSWDATPVAVHAGDESKAVLARLHLKNGGSGYAAFVLLRIGSTTEFVTVAAPVGARIAPAAIARLAALVDRRARRGLRS